MGRELRVDYEAAWQHVMNRGGRFAATFIDDDDRRHFLDLVGQLEERYGLEVHGYCLMGNHYHLLLRSVEGRLSEGMQWLGSCYTRAFNSRHGFDGPLFRGRFRSKVIDSDQYLAAAFRYVARNPLAIAGVSDLRSYPWSSHGAHVGARPAPAWLHVEFVDRAYRAGGQSYATFVETDFSPEAAAATPRHPFRPSRTSGAGEGHRVGTAVDELDPVVSEFEDIANAAAELGHLASMSATRSPRTTLRDARLCALLIAKQQTQMTDAMLADRLSYPTTSAVKSAINRAARRLDTDLQFADLFEQVRRRARSLESYRTGLPTRDAA